MFSYGKSAFNEKAKFTRLVRNMLASKVYCTLFDSYTQLPMSRVFTSIFLFCSLSTVYSQNLQMTDILEKTSIERNGEFYFGTLKNLKSEAKIRTIKSAYPKYEAEDRDSAYYNIFSVISEEWECDTPLAKSLAKEVHVDCLVLIDEMGNIDGLFYSINKKKFSRQPKAFMKMIFNCIGHGSYTRIDRYGKHSYNLSIGI